MKMKSYKTVQERVINQKRLLLFSFLFNYSTRIESFPQTAEIRHFSIGKFDFTILPRKKLFSPAYVHLFHSAIALSVEVAQKFFFRHGFRSENAELTKFLANVIILFYREN
jgi:hypothetical protein